LKKWLLENLLDPKNGVRLPGFKGEWEGKTLGSITKLSTGATPSTKNKEFWGGDIPWMNSGELNLKYINEVQGRITQEGYDSSSTKIIPKKCVLIGLAGQGKTRGTAAINNISLCTNQSIAAIWPDKSFDPLFLYHYMDNQYETLRSLSSGDGIRGGLNLEILRDFTAKFPKTIDEQINIGKLLTNVDNLIMLINNELNEWKQMKNILLQMLMIGIVRV
jgi:type I restriction enzyme S subunit